MDRIQHGESSTLLNFKQELRKKKNIKCFRARIFTRTVNFTERLKSLPQKHWIIIGYDIL